MKTLDLQQGTTAWLAHRATARNASDAPAMLGCSPYATRAQLLHQRHTGVRPEVDGQTQRRFDDGHAIEQAQLPGAEDLIGQGLYPAVGIETVDGIELSASFDGITMDESTAYECKTLNDDLRAALPYESDAANEGNSRLLPKHYRVQLEQQLMVANGERILFVAATANGEDVRRVWYYPDAALRAEILAGWKQFDVDLAAYVPPERAAIVVAEPVQALPAVTVQVTGSLAVIDNFKVFETAMRDFLEHRLIREPKSDQDFADLDVQIKAMKGAEAALEAAEGQMLAQVQSIDSAKKTKDMLHKLVRDNRLMAEKLLASEKERRKGEIVAGGVSALRKHIEDLNTRIGQPMMPTIPADFAGAIRGKSSLAKMEDAVDAALANAKIAANETADRITLNLRTMRAHGDYDFLFADIRQHIAKPSDDFQAMVQSRVLAHQAEEKRRAEAAAEKERERIRAEEQAKAERDARAKVETEIRAQAPEATQPPAVAPSIPPALSSKAPAANSPSVVPIARGKPTLSLKAIQERLNLPITGTFIETTLEIAPARREASKAVYWLDSDWDRICQALMYHVDRARTGQLEAA